MDVNTYNFGTNQSEKDTAILLSKLELQCVALNWKLRNETTNEDEGEIDGVFYDEQNQFYIVYDDSVLKEGRQDKIAKFLNKWKDERNQGLLRTKLGLRDYPIYVLYIDKSGKDTEINSVDYALDAYTKIIYSWDYEYFENIYSIVGKWARNDFYNFLSIRPRRVQRDEIDAIQIYVGNTPAYVYADRVENILSYSYISRRTDSSDGYQRMVDSKRVSRIASQIKQGKINSFPNSILLNCVDGLDTVPKSKTECPCPVKFNLPNSFSSCRVIDGQHRLLSFSKLDSNIQDSHSLPIVLFDKMPAEKEIQTFIDINDNQQGIDPNLIYSLKRDLNFQNGTPENLQKIGAKIAFELQKNVPFFKHNVFTGYAGEKNKKSKITLTTIVESLIEFKALDFGKGFLQLQEDDITSVVDFIRTVCLDIVNHDGANIFYKTNNGVRLIIQYSSLLKRNIDKNIITISNPKPTDIFVAVVKSQSSNITKKYGKAGYNDLSKTIFDTFKSYTVYKDFETDLSLLK